MTHDDLDLRALGERCGGWWSGGRAATGVRVTHECNLLGGHDGLCTCSCGNVQRPLVREDDGLDRESGDVEVEQP